MMVKQRKGLVHKKRVMNKLILFAVGAINHYTKSF